MKKMLIGVAVGIIVGCLAYENKDVRQLVENGKQKIRDVKNNF